MENKQPLPNAVASLILGICSLLFGCVFVGFICGIIGLAISGGSKRLYLQNPAQYSGYGMLNAGRVMSIIGIILGALAIIWTIVWVAILGNGMFEYLDFLGY
jgi:hypothetical protein